MTATQAVVRYLLVFWLLSLIASMTYADEISPALLEISEREYG